MTDRKRQIWEAPDGQKYLMEWSPISDHFWYRQEPNPYPDQHTWMGYSSREQAAGKGWVEVFEESRQDNDAEKT